MLRGLTCGWIGPSLKDCFRKEKKERKKIGNKSAKYIG